MSALEGLRARLDQFRMDADADLAALLQKELAGAIARYEQHKRRAGALDFLDLLLKARDLMVSSTRLRQEFQARFTHVFVDEFQDTDPLQAEILLQSLAEAANIEEQVGPMVAAWQAGDERGLEEALEEDFGDYPELAETLIYERNARWADQVDEMLEGDEDVLLVVGAMHLVGKRGLPALLRARGHRVDRL